MTQQYKTSFPTSWILSTAESGAIERSAQEKTTKSPTTSPQTPDVPSDRIRESLPPAALFLQQAGLTTPTTPIGTDNDTSQKRERVTTVNIRRQDTISEASDSIATGEASAMKNFVPRFKPEKSATKDRSTSPKAEKDGLSFPTANPATQSVPTHRAPFQWPNNPTIYQQTASQLYTVPEGSPTRLTADSLGMTAYQTNMPNANSGMSRSPASNSAGQMTAGTGISSRSSNYADVPSRLPRFPSGYSPMS